MSDQHEISVKAKRCCAIRLYGQTHYNKERIDEYGIQKDKAVERI